MVKILESVADVVSESQAVIITRRKGTKEQQRRKYENERHYLSIGANMVAASGVGAAAVVATNPLWVVVRSLGPCSHGPVYTLFPLDAPSPISQQPGTRLGQMAHSPNRKENLTPYRCEILVPKSIKTTGGVPRFHDSFWNACYPTSLQSVVLVGEKE
ncbi:hypothetical protein JHK85_003068 [Glycine max]|nr:hypothetical protein JHK85_003068 [Glycine max]